MSFRILGALQAEGPDGSAVPLGPPKQRALLAILLLHVGELVPTEQLIELLWGDRAPRTAAHSIQIYVSDLRRSLEPIIGAGAILTRPPGYQLQLGRNEIDANRFERLTTEGARALADEDRGRGATLLREALSLWRGPALSDFLYEDFAQPYIRRLHDLHLHAIETLAAAELEDGRVADVLALLEGSIREDPLRERSRELLMLALYRSGRHAEALRTFENLRQLLDEELGLDPSPPLRRLQERIILHDPALAADTPREAPAPTGRNPYKGLRAFTEEDQGDFFGRGRLVETLASTLRDGARLIALVGPSGSGKSSVVAAGLLPAVRGEWEITWVGPDQAGLDSLAALTATGDQHRLVVIDQFEELFSVDDDRLPKRFLDFLSSGVDDPTSGLAVVLTLRADFYDRPLLFPTFARVFLPGVINILPMTVEELEDAVVRPAERAGVSVEPTLVARLIADTADQPGALPLLQYALTELYDRRASSRLTLGEYQELGGLRGVLSRRAEEAFAALDADEQRTATQVFLRLVRPGRGTGDSRRRLPLSELTDTSLDPVALSAVLDTYGRNRLLSFDREESTSAATVEVAHEALLWEWDRLAGWIDRHRTALRRHETFVAALEEWEESGGDPGYLLTGSRLDEFAAWGNGGALRLTAREQEFLTASVDRRQAEAADASARAAELSRLERRNRRRLAAVAGVAALLVGGVAVAFAVLGEGPSTVALLHHSAGTVDEVVEAGFDRGVSDFGLVAIERDTDVGGAQRALEAITEEGPDLVFVFTLDTDVVAVAEQHPEIRFVGNAVAGSEGTANVRSLSFADEQGSFLAGAVAALHTKTGTVGFIGGIDLPIIWRFQAGFEAGAQMVDADIQILSTYLTAPPNFDGFVSPALGEAAARQLYQNGADVIYTAAGDSGTGVYQAADDLSVGGETHLWAIGVDTDQYYIGGINEATWQEHILTSMVKRVDVPVYETLEDEAEGSFTGGELVFGLASGALELSYSGGYIEPYRTRLGELSDLIVGGEITVPCIPADREQEAAALGITGCDIGP